MKEEDIKNLSEQTVKRYTGRYKEHRHGVKTLGWGSTEMQEYRFEQVLQKVDVNGKSLLDIGCGFGDLYNYVKKRGDELTNYVGWDITPDLIKDTLIKDEVTLEIKDISQETISGPVADVGVMLGLLNWKWENAEENYAYSKRLIKNALACVNETLVIDFLSTNYTDTYPVEDFVFYHNPQKMLEFAFELSNNVELVHSYEPIPQKEFLLIIHK